MRTAELIVRVLNAAADRYSNDNDDPWISPWAGEVVREYQRLKLTRDFRSAAIEAKTIVVQKILDEFKDSEQGIC